MTAQVYPTEPLHVQVNGPTHLHPQLFLPTYPDDQWSNYANCVSPNEATHNSPNHMMMNNNNYSPGGSNSLSPFTMQTPSSFPQLSPTNSDPSLSPLYGNSRLSTPTTPASTQSFMSSPTFLPSPTLMPSPTPSQEEHLLQQESQVLTSDVCHFFSLYLSFTDFIFIDQSAWLHSSTTTSAIPRCSITSFGWCWTLHSPTHVQATHYQRPQTLCGRRPARSSHLLLCGTFRPVWNFTPRCIAFTGQEPCQP